MARQTGSPRAHSRPRDDGAAEAAEEATGGMDRHGCPRALAMTVKKVRTIPSLRGAEATKQSNEKR
ncbi:MAG: hypothetical protein ACXW1O_08340 [Halobacteriota archaeon]